MNQDPTEDIAKLLMTKSTAKQLTYKNICSAFNQLKDEATKLIELLNSKTEEKDKDITLAIEEISDQEFHVKIAGDLLVFFLHTNIITLSSDYSYNESEYVKEDVFRKYLGQINVYNFLADSIKFNRLNDPGYLLARLLINCENHFIVEGDRQVNFTFDSISQKPLAPTDLNILIQLIIAQAVENDLVAPPFAKIRGITLQQKMAKTESLGGGNKIGFQMSSMDDVK